MDAATQTQLMDRIVTHLESGTDPMAEDVMMHPVDRYVRPDHLARERETLFNDYPLVIGYSDDVRDAGDFFTDDLTGRALLVVRGDDGVLRGFHNICGHRGAKVETGDCGSKRRFTCPYHSWSYDRTGHLQAIPYDDGFIGVDRQARSLVEVAIAERHGLVWARPSAAPDDELDIAAYLGPLDAELATFRMQDYVHDRTEILRQPFNWKLVVDGFLETYHIQFLHQTTIGPYIGSNFALFDPVGLHARMVGLRSSFKAMLKGPPAEREFLPHVAIIYRIFPNTVLVWQGDHFEAWSMFPSGDDAAGMVARASLLAPKPATNDEEARHWDKNWKILMDTVVDEDFVVARTIQAGFESGVRSHAVFGRQEATLQHFHAMLAQEMGDDAPASVPEPRRIRVPA